MKMVCHLLSYIVQASIFSRDIITAGNNNTYYCRVVSLVQITHTQTMSKKKISSLLHLYKFLPDKKEKYTRFSLLNSFSNRPPMHLFNNSNLPVLCRAPFVSLRNWRQIMYVPLWKCTHAIVGSIVGAAEFTVFTVFECNAFKEISSEKKFIIRL